MKLFFISLLCQMIFLHSMGQSADAAMKQVLSETGAVGISVAVVKDGKMIFTGAYGYKDLENKVALQSDHLFRIASISKSFSATSIMQLVEEGKVDLDEDVSKLIGFSVRNPKHPDKVITLRLMLSHLSSINDSQGYFNLDVIDPEKNPNWRNAYSDHAPGDKFQYCNLNFNMIGAIIEKVSQQRFDDYVIGHILRPLGLTGGYDVSKLDSSRFAYIYEYKGDGKKYVRSEGAYAVRPELNEGYVMGRTTPAFSPTGGMKISAPDLCTYMMMHMKLGKHQGKKIISKESELLMRQPASEKEPYGFALETTTKLIPGETLIGHTGVAYGQYSAMFFHPEKQYGVVVLINGCPPQYESGFNAVIRKTVNQLYTYAIAQDTATFIRINLIGYTNDAPKKALVISKQKVNEKFFLRSIQENTKTPINAIHSKNQPWDPFPFNYTIDFSSVSAEGEYRIETSSGKIQSPLFRIGPYPSLFEDVVNFMQTQRCGYNPYIDAVCHPLDGRSYYGNMTDKSYVDTRGGWHDAGDQLKYLITASNATARMMQAWEWNKKVFKDNDNAWGQKGGNGIADILDEAKWGLDWMHRLHPSSDQLIHQVADDRDHLGFKLPNDDPADYGFGVNKDRPAYFADGKPQGLGKYKSGATGVSNLAGRSAAAMAMGYRIWKNDLKDESFALQCLKDAKELYTLGKAKEGYQQGNSYGAPYRYNENTWADDMEWGAAELYKATGEKKYLEDAIHYANIIGSYSWMERDSTSHYEMYPYVNMGHYALWEVGPDSIKKKMIEYYAHNLDRILVKGIKNDYGVGHLFVWCSNNFAAAVATQAILYEKMTGDRKYVTLMQDHINWLLGLNPWGTSMITGIPEYGDFPLDVHMPFWRIKREVIKGSLVDGPLWSSIHEGMLQIALSQPDEYKMFQPKHITYWDDWADYSTNEPTMDGSADLFLLLTYLHVAGR